MKNNQKKLYTAAVVCFLLTAVLLFPSVRAQAAKKKVYVPGYEDRTITISDQDITGDGKKDKILIRQTFTGEINSITKIVIYINAKKALTLSSSVLKDLDVLGTTYVYARMTKTKNYFQVIGSTFDDYVCFNRIYIYNRSTRKLVEACRPSSLYGSSGRITKVTSKKMYVSGHVQPTEVGAVNYTLTYTPSGNKLKLSSKTVAAKSGLSDLPGDPSDPDYQDDGLGDFFRNSQFVAMKEHTFYQSYTGAKAKKEAFTIGEDDVVTLKKLRLSETRIWAQFENEDGVLGWDEVSKEYGDDAWPEQGDLSQEEYRKLLPMIWFYGVSDRLAG